MTNDKLEQNLCTIVDVFDKEDSESRERQLLQWRKLKLAWEGFQRVYYSEVARDWRIYSNETDSSNDQTPYNHTVNIFKAYLESIIAALSISVPAVKCYPDDADDSLDLSTAKTGDKIAELIYRHNNVELIWLHALYIFVTEGLVACYTYTKSDESYGTYKVPKKEEFTEYKKICPSCREELPIDLYGPKVQNEFQPVSNVSPISCPGCKVSLPPDLLDEPLVIERIVGHTTYPKSRVCMEVYGGLYVKVPNYAMKQADIPYLMFTYETHYTNALEQYPHLRDDLQPGKTGNNDDWAVWARNNPQYRNDIPSDNVTVRNVWLRPSAYNVLPDTERIAEIRKKFPDGCKVVMVNDCFAEAVDEKLDDHWTLTHNPLSDYLHHEPLGHSLTGIQEITDDLIALIVQTIEHGVGQTFADPTVLNFNAYKNSEVLPGSIFPAKAKVGHTLSEGFFELRTATLSQEVLPFFNKIQELAQLVSGALPSLFGGQLEGSKTASEYSMSRSQALQRLQNHWKMFTIWWTQIFGKAIPMYIKEVQEDERFVEKDTSGNFVNIYIRKAELEGKIGRIELEASENLPLTWSQKKDVIMELMQINNPEILQTLSSPENLPLFAEAIGLNNFVMPGLSDRQKQYEEIKLLVNSAPVMAPPDFTAANEAIMMGDPSLAQPQELPSVEIEPMVDNHNIHAEICRTYLLSDAGRLLKMENPEGYKNVLLHMKMHMDELAKLMMPAAPPQGNPENVEKPEGSASPLTEKENVDTVN